VRGGDGVLKLGFLPLAVAGGALAPAPSPMVVSMDAPVGRWVVTFNTIRLWDDGKFSKGFLVLSRSK
jgi:hypothetical protein